MILFYPIVPLPICIIPFNYNIGNVISHGDSKIIPAIDKFGNLTVFITYCMRMPMFSLFSHNMEIVPLLCPLCISKGKTMTTA